MDGFPGVGPDRPDSQSSITPFNLDKPRNQLPLQGTIRYSSSMHEPVRDLLRCVLTPGLGPVLLERLIGAMGSPAAVLRASAADLERVRGIGSGKATVIVQRMRDSERLADEELELAERLGVSLVARGTPEYPELLTTIPSAPPLLHVMGSLDPHAYGVAVVGSRGCTPYGIEQAERFASSLAGSGLSVISGGARGIDAAAHRGALRVGGRTVAVLGCGLANRYPPEHGELFDAIVAGGGAIVSELPLRTQPRAENFPARNRIVSGLSLGVLVIEASAGSGALITARYACEEHGREVMVVPGRVDSPASEGSLALLKAGEGALVTSARDVLDLLETPARHQHGGTHGPRYSGSALFQTRDSENGSTGPVGRGESARLESSRPPRPRPEDPQQCAVLDALAEPGNMDQLQTRSGLDASAVRVAVTMLELRGDVVRQGEYLARVQ